MAHINNKTGENVLYGFSDQKYNINVCRATRADIYLRDVYRSLGGLLEINYEIYEFPHDRIPTRDQS